MLVKTSNFEIMLIQTHFSSLLGFLLNDCESDNSEFVPAFQQVEKMTLPNTYLGLMNFNRLRYTTSMYNRFSVTLQRGTQEITEIPVVGNDCSATIPTVPRQCV